MTEQIPVGTKVRISDSLTNYGGIKGVTVCPEKEGFGLTFRENTLVETTRGALIAISPVHLEILK